MPLIPPVPSCPPLKPNPLAPPCCPIIYPGCIGIIEYGPPGPEGLITFPGIYAPYGLLFPPAPPPIPIIPPPIPIIPPPMPIIPPPMPIIPPPMPIIPPPIPPIPPIPPPIPPIPPPIPIAPDAPI